MTVDQAPSVIASFDIADLQGQLESILRTRRRTSLVVFVFSLGLALVLVSASVRPLESHTLGTTAFAALLVLLGTLAVGAILLSPTRANLKSGATKLAIDLEGFTLIYPGGRTSRLAWKDPSLEFDLIDTSPVSRSLRLVDTPYSIQVGGVRTLLSPAAYSALAKGVEDQGLATLECSPSPSLYTVGSRPRVQRVRQNSVPSIRP
jgi:hypothetical protein